MEKTDRTIEKHEKRLAQIDKKHDTLTKKRIAIEKKLARQKETVHTWIDKYNRIQEGFDKRCAKVEVEIGKLKYEAEHSKPTEKRRVYIDKKLEALEKKRIALKKELEKRTQAENARATKIMLAAEKLQAKSYTLLFAFRKFRGELRNLAKSVKKS